MSGAAIGRNALVASVFGRIARAASAIRRGAFFAVVMLSTLFASGAVYTIDYSVSGYKGSETLENFPVLVRLSANSPEGFDYNNCAANGADVYFTDASNNVLAHEIDTWDTSGESLIWVKIPSVTPVAQSKATFTMHYGSAIPATITLPDASSVWTAAGYSGVWHFGPAKGTDSAYGTVVSSTKGTVSYDGNDTYPGLLGGNLWTAVDSAVIYNYSANNAPWATLGTGNTLTLTCWARTTAASGSGRMLSTKSSWSYGKGFELTMDKSGYVTMGASGSTQWKTAVDPALDAQWRLVTMRYNGSEMQLFMDGADTKSSKSATITAPDTPLTFLAGKSGGGEYWKGGIDEVRIRPAASSGDWIQAEYDSSVESSTFLTAGVVNLHTIYYKSGVFAEDSSNLIVVTRDGEGNETEIKLSPGDNVVFDDAVAGENATVYFGETLPTGVTYSFSDNWTGTVLPQGVDTNTTYIWTGANGDGNMNTASNWYGNAAPVDGAAVYIPAAKTAAIVNNIENFAPASITFGSGSGQVTIGGNAITGVAAITNLSSAVQTFNAEVSGTAIDFYNSSTHCAFRGGIALGSATFSGANTEAARALAGAWTFTGGDAYTWTPVENNRVMDNSSVTVEGELFNSSNLVIDAGCVVTAATLRATGKPSAITKTNNGSLVVTGACNIETGADCYLASPADESTENSATVEFGSYIANNSGGWPRINAKDIIVGAGGMFASGIAVLAGSPVLHSRTGEFSIDSSSQYIANSSNTTTIDTTQYGTEDVPAEVTINARFLKRNGSNTYSSGGAMNVTGCGTLLFNSVSDFTGGLTVTDTATVAVNPGKQPGEGTVTVNSGATLQVAQSGTVALAGGLTLADGAALGFNFTEKDAPPVLNATGKTVTLGENKNVTVKVSAADGIRPKGGSYVLTSGGNFTGATVSLVSDAPNWAGIVSVNADGNIVLGVKSPGFLLIVK